MVASGRGARAGVLFKKAEALELLSDADTVLFDKTGTLTEGKPVLREVLSVQSEVPESQWLGWASAVERGSEHVLAKAVVDGAKARGARFFPAREIKTEPGLGLKGIVAGKEVFLGNAEYVRAQSKANDLQAWGTQLASFREGGGTWVFVADEQKILGALGVEDPIKSGAKEAIDQLRSRGLLPVMVTGDHCATADAVARRLGITDVRAEVKPSGKLALVEELKAQGRKVVMTGDGVNDAPALAAAHVGIAMASGTEVAVESASVSLVQGDISGVVRALDLSRATLRNIRQNLFFAFIYNTLGIPLAAGIFQPFFGLALSPMVAAAAMSLSSVLVIGNALRLYNVWFKLHHQVCLVLREGDH
jgi:Cu+-exporting ATPase